MKCPTCQAAVKSNGSDLMECSNFINCRTLVSGNKYVIVDFEQVKTLLNSQYLKTNRLAQSYLQFLEDKGFLTVKQLVYIIGTTNPKGKPTMQALVFSRSGSKPAVGTVYMLPEEKITLTPEPQKDQESSIPLVIDTEKVIVRGDETLLKTTDFPYIDYSFGEFNPLQSTTANYIEENTNIVVASATSSGKTIVAEQFIIPVIAKGKKAIYISPLKALTNEKYDDWTSKDHTFSKYRIEIITGDYILSSDRVNEINQADIILMTSEMLASRTIKVTYEKNQWLYDVGVMVIDECHLLGMESRGDHLESAMMRFSAINSKAKIIALSATMPNVQEIASWLTLLNEKKSLLIKSDWRPVQLDIHYEAYLDSGTYAKKEDYKAREVIKLLRYYRDDKFIVFVHTKATGRRIKEKIERELEEKVEFHSADLTKATRNRLEKSFKKREGGLRILISTSTIAYGCNMPARRVIIVGVHRGLDEVTSMDIIQMCVGDLTPIMMADGKVLHKNAIDVNIGDYVAGANGFYLAKGKVTAKYIRTSDARKITFSNGVTCIFSNHPVLSWGGKWLNSDNLQIGDKVYITTKSFGFSGITLKELFYKLVPKIDGKCRVVGEDLLTLRSIDNEILSTMLGIKKKSIHKVKKNGIIPISVAHKLKFKLQYIRSHRGRSKELDLESLDYTNFSWLLGLMASDGSLEISKDHTRFRMSQSKVNDDILNKYYKILVDSGFDVTISKRDKKGRRSIDVGCFGLVHLLNMIGIKPRKTKSLSVKFLYDVSEYERYQFISGMIDGDGSFDSSIRIATAVKDVAYDLKNILLSLNVKSYVTFDEGSGEVFGYPCDTSHYITTISSKSNINELLLGINYSYKLPINNLKYTKKSRPYKGDFWYTTVNKIVEIKDQKLCNFTVEGIETFICNDVVTHNCGRSGRYGIDVKGDAYVLVPSTDKPYWEDRIAKPEDIMSRMIQANTIAFHAITEIVRGSITNRKDLQAWYERSLAYFQRKSRLFVDNIEDIENYLTECNSMKIEDEVYVPTNLGRISAWMYFKPHDVHHWFSAFSIANEQRVDIEWDEVWLSWALSMESNLNYIPADLNTISTIFYKKCDDRGIKISTNRLLSALAIYHAVSGDSSVYNSLIPIKRAIAVDIDRIVGAVKMIDGLFARWGYNSDTYRIIRNMITYEVGRHLVDLCSVRNIGKVKATQLYTKGITTYRDLLKASNRGKIEEVLKKKTDDSLNHVRELTNV